MFSVEKVEENGAFLLALLLVLETSAKWLFLGERFLLLSPRVAGQQGRGAQSSRLASSRPLLF